MIATEPRTIAEPLTADETLLLEALSALAALVGELDSGNFLTKLRRIEDAADVSALGMAANRGRAVLRAIRRGMDEPSP